MAKFKGKRPIKDPLETDFDPLSATEPDQDDSQPARKPSFGGVESMMKHSPRAGKYQKGSRVDGGK